MSNIFLEEEFEEIFKNRLKIETYSKSIETLFGDRSLMNIDYMPYYQRHHVWDKHKAILISLKVFFSVLKYPPLIFFENDKSIIAINGKSI